MPRYLPVQLDAANEKIQAVYAEVEDRTGFIPNFIKTLAHSDNFLQTVADLYGRLLGDTNLSEKIRQLVILKTCKLEKCKYTVSHHTELAKKAGWTQEQIQAMDDYAQSDLFTYYEKEVLKLTELITFEPDEIPQLEYWTQLDNHFTSDQVVEMIILIGFFNMINRFVLSLEVELEPQFQTKTEKAVGA